MCFLPIEAQTRAFPKHIGLNEWPYGSVPERPLINEWLWGLQLIRLMLGRCWQNLSRWSILQFAFWGGLVGQPCKGRGLTGHSIFLRRKKLRSFHNEKKKKIQRIYSLKCLEKEFIHVQKKGSDMVWSVIVQCEQEYVYWRLLHKLHHLSSREKWWW